MKYFIWFLILFLLLLVQGGVLEPLRVTANLILIVVAISAILADFNQGLIITVMGGLLLDFLSGSPDGLASMSLICAFLFVDFLLKEILARDPNQFILASSVAVCTVIYFLGFLIFNKFFGMFGLSAVVDVRYILTYQLPLTLFWNLVFGYPIYQLYLFIENVQSIRSSTIN